MNTFLVLGIGPIGGIIGGRLARAGADVTFADVDPVTVDAVRADGLRLHLPEGEVIVPANAVLVDDIRGSFDTLLLSVPSSATEGAVDVARRHRHDHSLTVSLQNGLAAARLAEALGAASTAGCAIRLGSRRVATGVFATAVQGHLSLGHWRHPASPALRTLVDALNEVIDTDLSADIEAELWGKLCHTAMVYFECLDDASLVETLQNPRSRGLFIPLLAEVVDVAEASGLRLPRMADFAPDDFASRHPLAFRERALDEWMPRMDPTSRKGAFRRLREGGRTDVDEVLGVIVHEGASRSVPTPISGALQQLVHELESGRTMSPRNYRTLARLAAR